MFVNNAVKHTTQPVILFAKIVSLAGEKMRKVGTKGAPTAMAFKQAAKTAKPVKKAKK